MANLNNSFEVPYRDALNDERGFLARTWDWFFREVQRRLYALGDEKQFTIVNNQSTPADVTGLRFNKGGVSQAVFEYLIQRVTTGGSAIELIESGILIFVYRPTDDDWEIVVVNEEMPDDAGVDFTVTTDGQVQYTSSNESGNASISTLFYRARTIAGKNTQYSIMGAR